MDKINALLFVTKKISFKLKTIVCRVHCLHNCSEIGSRNFMFCSTKFRLFSAKKRNNGFVSEMDKINSSFVLKKICSFIFKITVYCMHSRYIYIARSETGTLSFVI